MSNLSKPVSMNLTDRIERTIQFTECTNTVDLLRECEEEISKLRAALKEIRDTGPMTLDDQRWRIALVALGDDK